jgi:hypothetical protein
MSEKYNGWNNRETWVINLWIGETLQEISTEYVDQCKDQNEEIDRYELAEILENHVTETFEEELNNMNPMLRDLLYIDSVDWVELAETYIEN